MSERRAIVAVGTAVTTLGAAVLISGLANLAAAPGIVAVARQTPAVPAPFSSLPLSFAIVFFITQNWLILVAIQLAFAPIVLTAGIGFLRRRSWARVVVEALGWTGAALLAVPIIWTVRWVLATPADRILGLRAGLETLPWGVGQPMATILQVFVGVPADLGSWFLGRMGVVHQSAAGQFAWTSAGVFVGTVSSIGIPAASIIVIVLVRRRAVREIFRRGVP